MACVGLRLKWNFIYYCMLIIAVLYTTAAVASLIFTLNWLKPFELLGSNEKLGGIS